AARAMSGTATNRVRLEFERVFAAHGLPRVIHSDNGAPFSASNAVLGLSRLSAWWLALGISVDRSRPAHPQDNGGHERMQRDMRAEVQAVATGELLEQQAALDVWVEAFNRERPHEALGMKTPAEIYQASERRYEGTPTE